MFFEGSEKKVEITIKASAGSLLEKSENFWHNLVGKCQAKILSCIKNPDCCAYLLSESSLFVWNNRMTMITCGQTTLVNSIKAFVSEFGEESISSVIYERKNEYFPQLQHSDFYSDLKSLSHLVSGEAYRFGNADEHHLHLFHMNKNFQPDKNDVTFELLMYGLQGRAAEIFRSTKTTAEEIRKETRIDQILPDFLIDDHVFEPFGYSLNAIREKDYFTVHVTPQELGNYVSFETNVRCDENYQGIISNVLEIFRPRSFDVVSFQPKSCSPVTVPAYTCKNTVAEDLSCGYAVGFSHFYLPSNELQRPKRITEFK